MEISGEHPRTGPGEAELRIERGCRQCPLLEQAEG